MEHRRVKRMYARVRKSHFVQGISKIERRERTQLPFENSEPLPYTEPEAHYHVSASQRYGITMRGWIGKHLSDPALDVCPQAILGNILLTYCNRVSCAY